MIFTRGTYVAKHETARSNDYVVGYADTLGYDRATADEASVSDSAAPVYGGVGGDVGEVADAAVVFDYGSGIDDAVVADSGAGVDQRVVEHHTALADTCVGRHAGCGGDNGGQSSSGVFYKSGESHAARRVGDAAESNHKAVCCGQMRNIIVAAQQGAEASAGLCTGAFENTRDTQSGTFGGVNHRAAMSAAAYEYDTVQNYCRVPASAC